MKKTCFLLVTLDNGGTETYLLRFIKHFSNALESTVISTKAMKGNLYADYLNAGTTYVPLKCGYYNIIDWIRIYRFFRRNRFDAVCDMRAELSGIIMLIAWLAGVKKRLSFFRHTSFLFPNTGLKVLYAHISIKLVNIFATNILSNSQTALESFFPNRKTSDNRFEVVQNGVDKCLFENLDTKENLQTYFGLPTDKYIIGHTGRVTEAKNHPMILDVAKRIGKLDLNIVFVLAGRDTEKLPKLSNVIALSNCTEIPKLLKCFDLYYFPSISEGQPNALIEAMISDLPFVASDIDPIKECIPAEMLRQLCPPTNIEKNIQLLLQSYNSNNNIKFTCKHWAIDKYDVDVNYNIFYDKL